MPFSATYIGAFCALNPEECPKEYTRVAIGAQYAQVKNQPNQAQIFDTQIYGGYLNVEGGISSKTSRTRFVISAKFGIGKQESSLSSPEFAKQNLAIFGEIRPKIGLNLATKRFPLYLNVAYVFEAYTSRKKGDGSGYSYLFHYVGGEVEGKIPFGKKIALEYAMGYDWLFGGGYGFGVAKDSSLSGYGLNGHSYALNASVGIAYIANPQKSYYLKVISRYQNLGHSNVAESKNNQNTSSTLSMPSMRNIVGMLEMGIEF